MHSGKIGPMPPTESTAVSPARRSHPHHPVAQLGRGMLMGAVDLVPGVSGGTVALVLGIYRHLIDALHSGVAVIVRLLRGDLAGARWALKHVPWVWMISLGVGILTVIFTLAGPLTYAIENYPIPLAGLFCGLITAAVIICWRQLLLPTHRLYAVAALSAVVTFIFLGLAPTGSADSTITAPMWAFFVGGGIAITAMILPGISGSFLLVLMGLYAQVMGAVADRNFVVIGIFALGCATGLALSATSLRWLLHRHHDVVLAAMIGLMIGSVRILWPWPGGFETTEMGLPTAGNWLAPTVLAVVGCAAVLGLDYLATRLRSQADVPGAAVTDTHPR